MIIIFGNETYYEKNNSTLLHCNVPLYLLPHISYLRGSLKNYFYKSTIFVAMNRFDPGRHMIK